MVMHLSERHERRAVRKDNQEIRFQAGIISDTILDSYSSLKGHFKDHPEDYFLYKFTYEPRSMSRGELCAKIGETAIFRIEDESGLPSPLTYDPRETWHATQAYVGELRKLSNGTTKSIAQASHAAMLIFPVSVSVPTPLEDISL
ncbi:MAG TPA: hypothetical protein VK534_00375 [Methylomirabilota bacterium]|nr:hypothetical protein [Methylomirabilota bacterium]